MKISADRKVLMTLVVKDKYNLIKLKSESDFMYKLKKIKYRLILKLNSLWEK